MPNDRTDASNWALAATNSARLTLSHAQLRGLVRHWTDTMKEAGLPPEDALAAVKSLVRETIVPRYGRYADGKDDADARLAFVRDASQWCIEAYFDEIAEPNDVERIRERRRGTAPSRPPDATP